MLVGTGEDAETSKEDVADRVRKAFLEKIIVTREQGFDESDDDDDWSIRLLSMEYVFDTEMSQFFEGLSYTL